MDFFMSNTSSNHSSHSKSSSCKSHATNKTSNTHSSDSKSSHTSSHGSNSKDGGGIRKRRRSLLQTLQQTQQQTLCTLVSPCSSSSSAQTVYNLAGADKVFVYSPADCISTRSLPSSSSAICSSPVGVKRKRASTLSLSDTDHELGFEPPSAKRQQIIPVPPHCDVRSVVSTGYSNLRLVHEIDTHSSSDSLLTAMGYDAAAHDDIPDSPNSLGNACGSPYDCDEEVISGTTSSSASSTGSTHTYQLYDAAALDDNPDTPNSPNSLGNIISAATSPSASSTASTQTSHSCEDEVRRLQAHNTIVEHSGEPQQQHHGERTPGQKHSPATAEITTSNSQPKVKSFDDYMSAHYDCMTPAADPEPLRLCPLPALSWANAHDVWQLMCKKDEQAARLRLATMLDHHPGLQPRMRAILLDWLIEVCEVYKLHRETYYLAVDYLDRYLSAQKKVQKTHLQLIGITCLFVAAKVEEIYPPKIGEFAYVTDGACQEGDILLHEILLLQALEWSISPVTPMGWIGVYMQLQVNNRTPASLKGAVKGAIDQHTKVYTETNDAFIYPQFSGMEFVHTAQLLDLCSLDVGFSNFPYSVIAAAAISHTFDRETALLCSGLDWHTIQPCAHWMKPFFHVIRDKSVHLELIEQNEQTENKYGLGHICPNIITDDSHIIQTHTTTMAMFDEARLLQEKYLAVASKIKQEASPATGLVCPEGLLTPPASSRKPLDLVNEEVDADDLDDANVENIDVIEKTL